jgi:hypothetical protein
MEPVPIVKVAPLLACPATVTTTEPVVAPVGTGATILVGPQPVGAAAVPEKVTVPVPWVTPKFEPAIVTTVPEGPDWGVRLAISGETVNARPFVDKPLTVTSTRPVVAPTGTGAMILVLLHVVGVAGTPLKVTALVP